MVDDFSSSEDSDYTETDVSIRGGGRRTHVRHRSASRHRHEPRAQFLAPVQQTRVHRSASTGGSRRREPDWVQPNITIFNEQGLRSNNRPMQQSDNHPTQQTRQQGSERRESRRRGRAHLIEDDDDIIHVVTPPRHGRGASHEGSPFHRDTDLIVGQHVLQHSDFQQSIELNKHEMEIERLERELNKIKKKAAAGPRLDRDLVHVREDATYEEHLAEKLRRLQHLEHEHNMEEEQRKAEARQRERQYIAEEEDRKAEARYKMKQMAAAERAAAEAEEIKRRLEDERLKASARRRSEQDERERLAREENWKRIAQEKEEEDERKKLIEAIKAEDAKKEMKKREEREKERAAEEAAIEKWKLKQREEAERKKEEEEKAKAIGEAAIARHKLEEERKKQKEAEEAAAEKVAFRKTLVALGYSEKEIEEIMIQKQKESEEKVRKSMLEAAKVELELEEQRKKAREAKALADKEEAFRAHLRELGYSDEEIEKIVKRKEDEKKQLEVKEQTKMTWIKV
jgi:Holliday junction resolvasome RuvABC DNA-binding subunit